MTIQHFHTNTIRNRKNSEWLHFSGNSEKPENDTKIKILKFQDNYNKSSLLQGLEQYYKVTPCNEKCNFFILLFFILLSFNLLKSITSIQFLFVGTGSPLPYFRYIIHGMKNGSSKYMIYRIRSNILSKWIDKIFHFHTIPNQWMRRIEKDTKFIVLTNSCNIKKVSINPV